MNRYDFHTVLKWLIVVAITLAALSPLVWAAPAPGYRQPTESELLGTWDVTIKLKAGSGTDTIAGVWIIKPPADYVCYWIKRDPVRLPSLEDTRRVRELVATTEIWFGSWQLEEGTLTIREKKETTPYNVGSSMRSIFRIRRLGPGKFQLKARPNDNWAGIDQTITLTRRKP